MEKLNKAQDNFYYYVNKNWLDDDNNKIPDEYPRWGGFTKLHDNGLKNQIKIVKELENVQNKNDEQKKIYAIWNASEIRFNKWRNDKGNYKPIIRELEILDAYFLHEKNMDINNYVNSVAEYLYYTQVNGITNVFDFDKGSDLENSNNIVLDISTSGLSLPSREYYTDDNFINKRELFKKHLENIKNLINNNTTIVLDNNFVENVIDFENTLAKYKMKKEQIRRYDEYYTNTTLENLYKEINKLKTVDDKFKNYNKSERNFKLNDKQITLVSIFFEKLYELFNFREIMKNNLDKNFTKLNISNPPYEEQIVAYDGDAIRRISATILNPNNFNKYKSFLQYKIICSFKSYCTKNIDDEFFDFYARTLSGQKVQKSEDKRTISLVNSYAGEMLGKLYVNKYFPSHYKNDVQKMILDVINVMKKSLQNNNWLTEETKKKALEKLSKFTIKIGYPDVWKDYSDFDIVIGDNLYDISKKAIKWSLKHEFYDKLNSIVDHNEWLMTPQTVNAYFMPTQNEIVFPAAILQPPFYCKTQDEIDFDLSEEQEMMGLTYDFTNAVNFGGICAVIAHEITHGYDDKGRKFNGDGNLENWWSDDDAKLFKEKTDIMKIQALNYTFTDNTTGKTYNLNPDLTMGENLADLGGLSLSLQAMNYRLNKLKACDKEINACTRVMFKSFANIWKEKTRTDFKINAMTTDPHSPSDFRANLVKNMDEFYDVFNVTENDKMYIPPEKRVRMW